MGITLVPRHSGCLWEFRFTRPALEELKESNRLAFVNELIEVFKLQLDDITFNHQKLTHDYIKFTRFFEGSLIDFTIGMETAKISIKEYKKPNAFSKSYFDLVSLFGDRELGDVILNLHIHCKTETDVGAIFNKLCSYDPPRFSNQTIGRGVNYYLEFNEINLFLIFGVSPSLSIENGIFVSFYFQFSDLAMGYDDLFNEIARIQTFALEGVELDFNNEVEL